MNGLEQLEEALTLLGETLADRNVDCDLVIIGGGALLLSGIIDRPTADVDALARMVAEKMRDPAPFPADLVTAITEVGAALGLATGENGTKAWLNTGPAGLLRLDILPSGFASRLDIRTFGALTIRVASRIDLIYLKLLAATAFDRIHRKHIDIEDLQKLKPTRTEATAAGNWVASIDGRPDTFELDVQPVLDQLGFPRDHDAT